MTSGADATEAIGRLIGIARRDAPRKPMETLTDGLVTTAAGLDGDHKGAKFPRRQITVLAIEDWRAALEDLTDLAGPVALPWTARRANLLVEGIELPKARGGVLAIGEIELEVNPVLVAGPNFGIGSSREQAASVLVHLGVAAVVAPSFAGLFFRNAFNVGLLLLTCPRADEIADGVAVRFDARAGGITLPEGRRLPTDPIPGFLLDLVDAGGLLPHLKKRLHDERHT